MNSRDGGVNPLRPYYIPPSIGDVPEPMAGAGGSSGGGSIRRPGGSGGRSSGMSNSSSYTNKARDMFSDMDYKDYMPGDATSSSALQPVREIVDDLLWRYLSVLMAQPFEVAKTILQTHSQGGPVAAEKEAPAAVASVAAVISAVPETPRRDASNVWAGGELDDSDPDEPNNYFSSTSSQLYTKTQRNSKALSPPLSPPASTITAAANPNAIGAALKSASSPTFPSSSSPSSSQLSLQKPGSIVEALSQLWQREGLWGVWKGSNASFLYTVLQSLFETWSRSLLCALFNVPDLGLQDDVDRLIDIASPYPWASLFVAATAAVATGLILSPLDMLRTRLILTPISSQPRRVLALLRNLPSHVCAPVLVLPTILHSLIHPIFTLSTPLVLRTRFMIDRDLNPITFSAAKFCSSSLALFIKLPLETVLRRGQAYVASLPAYQEAAMAAASSSSSSSSFNPFTSPFAASALSPRPYPSSSFPPSPSVPSPTPPMETIVPLGPYRGVFGTMHHIVFEEGTSAVPEVVTLAKTAKAGASVRRAKAANMSISETVYRRGQGMEGLWRGWKVSWWGLVGLWTAAAVGGGGNGEF